MQGEEATALPPLLGLPAWAFALAGLLAGLVVTASVLLLQRANMEAEARLRDSQAARRSVVQVMRQFEASGLLLRAVQSAFLVDDDISREQFAGMYENLRSPDMLPSLLAMVFARREPPAEPGARPHYRYHLVAPLAGNESLSGFDMAPQEANLRALLRARDTDRPVMSAAFTLRQPVGDPRDALGVVVRLPVYGAGPRPVDVAQRRRQELGALGISMRVRPMLLAAFPQDIVQHYRMRVFDVTDEAMVPLFDSGGEVAAGARSTSRDVSFGERRWRVELQRRGRGYDAGMLWMMGLAGAIASLLLALLLWSVATTRRRAVTLGQQIAERYRESEERFRTLNDLLPALVLMARADDGRVVYANEAASARLGEGVASDTALVDLFEDEMLRHRLASREGGLHWNNVDAALLTRGGDRFWASTSLTQVQMGGLDRLLMVASDISEQRQLTEMLSYQATHDALTGLCNRREFERAVRRELQSVARGGPPAALLYIDLDQFKLINDTSGHLAGDQLLSQLALAMAEHLRGDDLLARLGGDEFGVLAHDVSVESTRALAERLRTRIEGLIYVWEQRSYTVSASIGVVMVDRPGMTLDDALAHADAACYMAKDHGRNRIHFYSAQDDETLRRRGEMEWANRLRWVIDEGRLLLDYQEVRPLQERPAQDPHIELLLRLRDEDGRVVMPGAFLPAAERYGLMPALDRWVIGAAIEHFDRLHASGRAPGRCSINLAASTLDDDGLADYVLQLIDRHGVAPGRLCFEITETEAMRNFARALRVMERLRAFGCQVALDDFGAGMSSFGYLKNLPVDVIKIDGSFIRELDVDPMSRSIVDAITEIGHQRGLDVVAEWVASEGIIDLLRQLGVDYGQGFALHQPERVLYQRG
ncbi:MAG TPA: EAL domain-containing protein [Luteimonas sp.]|nr:EAL domain-containing protein [Luteimonas sp.]